MTLGQVSILAGNTFLISDGHGDVDPAPELPSGLYSFDVRFLSTWVLTLDGKRLVTLSLDEVANFEARFVLAPGTLRHHQDSPVSVIRHRTISEQLREEVTLLNHTTETVEMIVRMEMANDFGSIVSLRTAKREKGKVSVSVHPQLLCFHYERETFRRRTEISCDVPGEVDSKGMTFRLRIPANESWLATFTVRPIAVGEGGHDVREQLVGYRARGVAELRRDLDEWMADAPRLACDCQRLGTTYRRSLHDLASLRYRPLFMNTDFWIAGLPWYMSYFGRDAIIASLQTLPFRPQTTPITLRALFTGRGVHLDDFREEEPGKIHNETNYGELSAFQELPLSPYFGAADVTPLAIILLDEYERWSGDVDLVRELESDARAALTWIDTYGDLLGNGYLWYQRRNLETGLENQGWKSSPDAISFHDGRLPASPRATCELQGYAYDAKRRGARLARQFWHDPGYADELERSADELRERFNRDFWIADREYYALALDPDGRQVDALASNMGRLLWSGIVPQDRAAKVAEHLMGPRLYSGWGVRTLAAGEARFNPLGYHVGTVWPFDNSFIAWGLRRYGFEEEAGRIAQAMLDAALHFGGRLPEAFAGYDRQLTTYPVPYPAACSPHAVSAGAALLLLRMLLGLEPDGEYLVVDPALPPGMGRIELLDIPGRWGRHDAFARSHAGG